MENPASVAGLTGRGLPVGDGPGDIATAVAEFRLGEAWRALRRELARLDIDPATAVATGTLAVEDLADVVCQAVVRVLSNPGGLLEESGSIDDYRETRKHSNASQDVYFTAAELRRLTPASVSAAPTAGSFKYS